MSLLRNIAGQNTLLQVRNHSTGAPVTGDAANITAYVWLDGAIPASPSTNSVTELSAANAPGWYALTLSQAETNSRTIFVVGNSSTANVEVIGVEHHTFQWTYDTIDFDTLLACLLAAAVGVAERTSTGVTFNRRDGTTDLIAMLHDAIGNRSSSTITPL